MKNKQHYLFIVIFFLLSAYTVAEDFKVIHQLTGFSETNCYLIYDIKSKEAAIIDPGLYPDTLIHFIKDNNLTLKYIFLTHGHTDHVYGVPEIRKEFPKVKVCMSKVDYENMFTQFQWFKDTYGQWLIDRERKNPEHKAYMDFDPHLIGIPDIFIENNQSFELGSLEIKAMNTPGHSPGEICYYTKNILFSGDVLMYRTVGGVTTQGGSKEELIKSVRQLYKMFPDSTIVYPGHGEVTDIGSEKNENENISLDKENMQ
jgi:glyoxylase-like metal-dependent hydrolase (beta-lactamase superfamily II)